VLNWRHVIFAGKTSFRFGAYRSDSLLVEQNVQRSLGRRRSLWIVSACLRSNSILWRTEANRLPFDLKEGQKVICGGYIDLYAQRGNYQLIVKKIQPVGVGALQLAFQQLKEKLSREGLFDPVAKNP